MNKITVISSGVLFSWLILSISVGATDLAGCAAKRADIENQLRYAKAHNNIHKIAGLQAALNNNEDTCTDAGLLSERKRKIAEKQRKVMEREQELAAAGETGDLKKIKQKEKKLQKAQEELTKAQSEILQ
ncbi:TPA: DUF1090 domain-containing protein [Salmonella enterica subsp. salamae serovar 9,46:z4,z24:z39:z42]|nr:DUF1090 domain-containing protein [Salmonella enterica subsp. salamae serovar 9,46:z4,z24:z39:z42]